MKCLYVGYDFSEGKNGGNIVRKNNHKILRTINEIGIDDFFISNDKKTFDLLKNIMKLSFNGGNKEVIDSFKTKLAENKYTHVFFDGSFYGKLVKYVKQKYPDIKIITFFHNVEVNYYWERVKSEGVKNLIILPTIIYNEKLSVKYSDKVIVLNERDKRELRKKYERGDACIIPITLEDKFNPERKIEECNYDYLFIGSAFFANIHGISWFIDKVLPNVSGKLTVVGKGMEILKEKYEDGEKLEIVGTVDNIEKYYYEDNIIVSPIFYGSGMKTKTIEALMYQKLIIGTNEAFVGIEKEKTEIVNTAAEFILALKNNNKVQKDANRMYYLNNFSPEIAKGKYYELFKDDK